MVSAVVRHLILIAFGLWSSLALAAAGDVPASFTLDGRLFEANSSVPLNDTVTFRVQILNGDKTCVLYEETQDRATSSGYFNLQIGSINVNDPKRSGGDSHNPMSLVFQNSKPIPATGCASPHVPQPGEARFARITVIPHSTALAQTMSPDVLLDSVPNALVAETLQGSTPDDFIRAGSVPELTQNAVEDLVKGDSLLYLRANSNGASLPVFSSNPSSPSAGQMWFDSSGVIKFYNGSSVQTLGVSGAGITSLTAGAGLSGGTITTSGTIALASLHGSAGTAVKTNYDVYGRVTGSTALTASDIPAMEYAGLLNSNGLSPWPTACGAAEFLRWESTTDTFVCDAVTATQITTGLGYTPVNKAGDSMSGALVVPADGLTVGTSQLVAAGGNIGIGTATPASPLDVNGLVRSVSLNVGDVSSEKTFRVSFAGVANEKVQVYWPSNTSPLTGAGRAQGLYEVTLSAGFDSGNYSGGLQKRFGLYGRATGSMTVQQTDVPFVLGATAASYAISDVMWDAANSRWYFVVANRTSNAGTISLHVRSTTPYNFPAIRAENLQITDVYDTDTTAYAQMYPTLTGSVGIGTTAPAGALDVRGTDGTIFSRNTSATAFAGMNMYNEAGVATGSIQIGGASTATQFRNNMFLGARQAGGNLVFVQGISAGEIARFDSSGRLGIGTNNPQYTLDVNGSFNATSMSLSGNIVATGGTNGSFTQNAVDAATGARSALTLQNKGTGGANEYNLVMKNAAGTTTASVAQDGTASFATSVIAPALRGSTAASANLTIESTSHGTKGHILLAPNGGNVGVGTTAPNSKMHLFETDGASTTPPQFIAQSTSATWLSFFASNTYGNAIHWSSNKDLRFGSATTNIGGGFVERARLTAGGYLGIGTTTPGSYLDITGSDTNTAGSLRLRSGDGSGSFDANQILFSYNGANTYSHALRTRHQSGGASGNAYDFYVWNYGVDAAGAAGTKHVMTLDGTGYVGIGTTSPRANLEIQGATGATSLIGIPTSASGTTGTPYYLRQDFAGYNYAGQGPSGRIEVRDRSASVAYSDMALQVRGAAGTLTTPVFIDGNGGNVGIGNTSPKAKLQVAGGIMVSNGGGAVARDVYQRNGPDASLTGTIKVTMPNSWSTTMMRVRINGYNYGSSTGAWSVIISGYNYSVSSSWHNVSAQVEGRPPFSQVRLGHDGTKNVILLGDTTTTTTSYSKMNVAEVEAYHSNSDTWATGWNIEQITDETGITATNVPITSWRASGTNISYVAGNVGIGTSSPGSQLEVVSQTNAATRGLNITQNTTDAAAAMLQFKKSRGTTAAPAAVASGDFVGFFQGMPHDGTNYLRTSAFGFRASGAATTGSAPTDFIISTGATDDSTLVNERLRITSLGNVGIGTVTPGSNTKLNVNGQIKSGSAAIATGDVDFALGNTIRTSFDCSTDLSFANLRDGASYQLVVTEGGTSQCNFATATTGDDAATVIYKFRPANASRLGGSHTIYSIFRAGNVVYVGWSSGW